MRNYFIFDGQDSRDYDVYISGHKTFNSPERNYTFYDVPGRNGSIAEDGDSFKNIELAYENSFIMSEDPFDESFSIFKNFLLSRSGYCRLEDSYHPNEFRMAVFRKAIEPTMSEDNAFGVFDLIFECKPQRFLKSGDVYTVLTKTGNNPISGSVYNSGTGAYYASKPEIVVFGKGQVNIGNYSFRIESDLPNNIPSVTIDCDVMDCYYGATNLNKYVSFTDHKFPKLNVGQNSVSAASTISQIKIKPRCFRI